MVELRVPRLTAFAEARRHAVGPVEVDLERRLGVVSMAPPPAADQVEAVHLLVVLSDLQVRWGGQHEGFRCRRATVVDVSLERERVAVVDGSVLINGKELAIDFELNGDHASMHEVIVPANHFFVLGDNRPVSCDSREFGLVQGELLKGKVRVRFWPLDRLELF